MKKNVVPWQARLFALVFIVVVTFAVATKRAERSVGSKVETLDPVTGSVTSVTETPGITIVHDRGARLNFVPAKSGTNVGK